MEELFATYQYKSIPILLIDASGSVIFNRFGDKYVFDQIKNIIENFPESEFRIIFWNSAKGESDFFKEGIYRIPFVVKKSTLGQTFTFVREHINKHCLTYSHLGFVNIPNEWMDPISPTKIYFITDGEMGYQDIKIMEMNNLKKNLSDCIKKLFTDHPMVQLNIITVEPKNMNFNEMETLKNAAGCDVYNLIMENQLTMYITKFISYTLNNLDGFVHINKIRPPPGFVPFGDKYFSELKVNLFVQYLVELISSTPDENELLKIVQYLSSTVATLIKDKPKRISEEIIKMFCGFFNKTTLDPMFVKFILSDAVEKENAGMASIFTMYRQQLKDLYKQAQILLGKNVKEAIGIGNMFLTIPIADKIISGHFRMIDKNIFLGRSTYSQSAVRINNILIPIIPFDYQTCSKMNEQCLRQWMRVIIGKSYHVDNYGDIVIYTMLGILIRICCSNLDPTIINSYRHLASVMLKKVRTNSTRTELERLENGELPIPNSGKVTDFYNDMNIVNQQLETKLEPMTLWYIMCLALDNEMLIKKQIVHCFEDIKKDFPDIEPSKLLFQIKNMIKPIVHHQIPFENVLDYNCLITMENVTNVGGYRFLPHPSLTDTICAPIYVLSTEGYQQLLKEKHTSICPICYHQLDESNFEQVGPKPQIDEKEIFEKDTMNMFTDEVLIPTVQNVSNEKEPIGKDVKKLSKKGTLIIMKGVVGSGKSFYCNHIKEAIEKLGGYCLVEGTDKYCKDGMDIAKAIGKVKESLDTIDVIENKLLVVIIDTCGERNNSNIIFDKDFTGWNRINVWPNLIKSDMLGYLSWSLRNILNRPKPGPDDNYWLNPVEKNPNTCIEIHKRKATALFGKKIPKLFEIVPRTKEEIIEKLNENADAYQEKLLNEMPLDMEIDKIVKQCLN